MLFKYLPKQGRSSCPFLPQTSKVLRPSDMRSVKTDGSLEEVYIGSLTTAQSLWLAGLPAQALLQLNHVLALEIPEEFSTLTEWPLPYAAKVWMMVNHDADDFIGNPVRHYQHLATRVSGPNKELRSWRAWACFHLAESCLATDSFPRDLKQMEKETLTIPLWPAILEEIRALKGSQESDLLKQTIRAAEKNELPEGDLS